VPTSEQVQGDKKGGKADVFDVQLVFDYSEITHCNRDWFSLPFA
jgi:hypothetical protein